ncbi:MAG: IclR family transcriptional regulator [Clostridia bacterium]|nr:IclR family transcriptional regulator [Clostridia bacterium]
MKEIVQSVDRSLGLLELLAEYPNGVSIADLSKASELHKSTVHRLLTTLIYKGFVKQNPADNTYLLSLKLFELGASIVNSSSLREVASPHLKALRDLTGEVVHLVVPEAPYIVYIDKFDSKETIRMHSSIGKRSPMYCTSVGRAILATYSDERIQSIWNESTIEKLTQHTITDFDSFLEMINEVRKNQYAEDNEENELQVRCFGAAIKDYKGETVGAISISTPIIRLDETRIEQFKQLIIEYSHKISKELGY